MRWVRFNLVGMAGFAVQITTLSLLVRGARLVPTVAIAIAVLAALSHNFFWHERFTWADRPREGRLGRWLSFHATTGTVSLLSNIGLTSLVMVATGLPVVPANLVVVVLASAVNFLINDRLVFRPR